jgi:uncharacterized protein YukE
VSPSPADPRELYAIAGRLAAQAEALREAAARVAAATDGPRWRSPAGAAFRARAHGTAVGMRRCADRIDDAAELLRRHAARLAAARPPGPPPGPP